MNLFFDKSIAKGYKSQTQIARVLTENWVLNNSFCPSCGNEKLSEFANNNPAGDFFCNKCHFEYELKSTKSEISNKIVDGAYKTMINKISNYTNPSFFFLQYTTKYSVKHFFTIPKHFFIPEIIEKRNPLGPNARRSGWVGCNILIGNVPSSARIFFIKDEIIIDPKVVVKEWARTSFLNSKTLQSRGWLVEMISIIDGIPNKTFTLSDVYAFAYALSKKFPNNKFVKEKIRQQLQVLRNQGFIKFIGNGIYKKN